MIPRRRPHAQTFQYGDYVEWNSEKGFRGAIVQKMTSDVRIEAYFAFHCRSIDMLQQYPDGPLTDRLVPVRLFQGQYHAE